MGEIDIRAARDRIDTVEKRIAAMHDAGVDVAALRAQLAFAHHALREGRLADIEAICDEVLGAARRLAELGTRASQVRTPAHGTPVPTPQPQPPAGQDVGTEALRRVKVGRAQLADEVRAAIDAEVRQQMQAPPDPAAAVAPLAGRLEALERRLAEAPPPPEPDLGPLVARLDALDGRLAAQRGPDLAPLADRLGELERRLAAAPDLAPLAARIDGIEQRLGELAGAAAGQDALLEQLRAVDARLGDLAAREAAAPAADLQALGRRLAAVEAAGPAAPALDEAAVAAIVNRTVDEVVPRQASELLREAIAKLPTRDDLHQIAETLRADLDWRLEKAAAEHGWCSLADVQATVRKSLAEHDPGAGSGGSHLGRLEIAMAEFVQQSKEQQERLISALAERVVQHTRTLTKRMLVREPPAAPSPPARHETEELAPSLSTPGDGSSRMAAITSVAREDSPSKRPTEMALDPVPAEVLDASRRAHGDTTLFTKRVASPPEPAEPAAAEPAPAAGEARPPDLHDLVTAEVERALAGAAASTMTALPAGEGSDARPPADAGERTTAVQPAAAPAAGDLPVLVAAEVGRQLAMTVPVHLPPSDADLARAIARALPQALQDDAVRTELFAVLALEAAGKPGALGELTGLRRFLRREIQLAVDRQGQPTA